MSVPIKFRGRDENTGEFVYGDICQTLSTPSIVNCEGRFFVKPDSVAQLVNYDDDGKELYENDTVVDKNDDEYCVCFERIAFGRFCALKFDDEIEYRGLLRLKTNDD